MQQDQMFNAFTEQARSFYQPMRKFNALMLDQISKVAEYQMDAAKRYTETGIERARAATEVKDAEGLGEFSNRQLETVTELSQQMMDDSMKLAEMGNEMRTQLEHAYSDAGKQGAGSFGGTGNSGTGKSASAGSAATSAPASSKPASASSRAKQG
ncbi:phasin family protein [Cobetia crustatorum]|uniref:phasin family protein n=1 Tax=Cobetia crustatorum TaxID=553385 RepID=UPI000469A4D4|nr:phasin family protein [Cobetia crustatorum]